MRAGVHMSNGSFIKTGLWKDSIVPSKPKKGWTICSLFIIAIAIPAKVWTYFILVTWVNHPWKQSCLFFLKIFFSWIFGIWLIDVMWLQYCRGAIPLLRANYKITIPNNFLYVISDVASGADLFFTKITHLGYSS
jgi:hypothetical protein